MPLLLRINFQQKNFIFQVLTEKPSLQPSLEIFFDGKTYIFQRHNHSWEFQNINQDDVNQPLFEAIGKALALRFRISTSVHI